MVWPTNTHNVLFKQSQGTAIMAFKGTYYAVLFSIITLRFQARCVYRCSLYCTIMIAAQTLTEVHVAR